MARSIKVIALTLSLGTAALLGGCHMIFGDYTIKDEPPVSMETANLCVAGSARCVGPWLYACSGDGQSWEETQPCASAEHCSSRQGQCRACIPETHRCNSTQLEVCGSDGRWSPVETCDSEDLCNLNSDSCRPCTIGEFQCNNGELLQCSESRTWDLIDTCDTVEACVVAENRRSGSCGTPVCDNPGGHQCNGAQLLRCTLARDRLVEVATCEGPEFCDPAAADLQASQGLLATCLTPCEPNSVRCVGAELQSCSAQQTWQPLMSCPSEHECNATAGTCQPCTPGSVECNDGVLRTCSTLDGTWETLQNCGAAHLCNAQTGTCTKSGCPAPGRGACLPDGLHTCPANQEEWDFVTFCTGDRCNANDQKCDTAVCTENETRCEGNSYQRCNPSLLSWDVLDTCDAGETCDLDGCQPGVCNVGSLRCNNLYLEVCEEAGWQRIDRCATAALCDAENATCKPPVCGGTLAEFNCLGPDLQRCKENRTGWDDFRQCSSEGLTCDASTGTCVTTQR